MYSTSEHEIEQTPTFCGGNQNAVRFVIKHNTPQTLLLAKICFRAILVVNHPCLCSSRIYILLVGIYYLQRKVNQQ